MKDGRDYLSDDYEYPSNREPHGWNSLLFHSHEQSTKKPQVNRHVRPIRACQG